jgi:hypothetical protein
MLTLEDFADIAMNHDRPKDLESAKILSRVPGTAVFHDLEGDKIIKVYSNPDLYEEEFDGAYMSREQWDEMVASGGTLREAYCAYVLEYRLNSRNFARLVSFGKYTDTEEWYIAYEYISGRHLNIREHGIDIALQMVNALRLANVDHGFVHCDVASRNVIVATSEMGRQYPVFIDYGNSYSKHCPPLFDESMFIENMDYLSITYIWNPRLITEREPYIILKSEISADTAESVLYDRCELIKSRLDIGIPFYTEWLESLDDSEESRLEYERVSALMK